VRCASPLTPTVVFWSLFIRGYGSFPPTSKPADLLVTNKYAVIFPWRGRAGCDLLDLFGTS